MTGANRWRVLLLGLGITLGAASLIGAKQLLQPNNTTNQGGNAAKAGGTPLNGGIVVLGTVDSVPSPSLVGPPARIKQRYRAWEDSGADSISVRSRQPEAIEVMAQAARLN